MLYWAALLCNWKKLSELYHFALLNVRISSPFVSAQGKIGPEVFRWEDKNELLRQLGIIIYEGTTKNLRGAVYQYKWANAQVELRSHVDEHCNLTIMDPQHLLKHRPQKLHVKGVLESSGYGLRPCFMVKINDSLRLTGFKRIYKYSMGKFVTKLSYTISSPNSYQHGPQYCDTAKEYAPCMDRLPILAAIQWPAQRD